jgi:hypothetical protein
MVSMVLLVTGVAQVFFLVSGTVLSYSKFNVTNACVTEMPVLIRRETERKSDICLPGSNMTLFQIDLNCLLRNKRVSMGHGLPQWPVIRKHIRWQLWNVN